MFAVKEIPIIAKISTAQGLAESKKRPNRWFLRIRDYYSGLRRLEREIASDWPLRMADAWYVVSLEVPEKSRNYLGTLQRFTLAVKTPAALQEAYQGLKKHGAEFAITALQPIEERSDGASFFLSDLNRNWWEISCARNQA